MTKGVQVEVTYKSHVVFPVNPPALAILIGRYVIDKSPIGI